MKKESFETEYENVLYNLEYCRDWFSKAIDTAKYFKENPVNSEHSYWDAYMYLEKVRYAARLSEKLPVTDWLELKQMSIEDHVGFCVRCGCGSENMVRVYRFHRGKELINNWICDTCFVGKGG